MEIKHKYVAYLMDTKQNIKSSWSVSCAKKNTVTWLGEMYCKGFMWLIVVTLTYL